MEEIRRLGYWTNIIGGRLDEYIMAPYDHMHPDWDRSQWTEEKRLQMLRDCAQAWISHFEDRIPNLLKSIGLRD